MQDILLLGLLLDGSGYKLRHVASALGISTATLRRKLGGQTEFKLSEAEKLAALLHLSAEQREQCFFGTAHSVQRRADEVIRRYAHDKRPDKQNQGGAAQV